MNMNVSDPSEVPGSRRSANMNMTRTGRTLLAIDDNELNMMSLRAVLQVENIRMLEAKNIEGGIRMLHRRQADLILIGHGLAGPGIGRAVQLIKEDTSLLAIPIVVFAANGNCQSRVRPKSLEPGVDGFISDPILSRAFLEALKSHMGHPKEGRPRPSEQGPETKASPSLDGPAPNPSVFDWVTGHFNQAYIHNFLSLEIKRALRHGYAVSLIKLDVDDFKKHNTRYGRPLGDLVLREVGEVVRDSIRDIDLAGRSGSDEFLIVLPYSDLEGAIVVARRLLSALQSHKYSPGISILTDKVSVCLGIASCPSDVSTAEKLLLEADLRLRKAREQGKNQYCVPN